MSPQHHPSEATRVAYAAGSLGEGFSLAVAAHFALCPACRLGNADIDAVGGVLLDDLPPTDLVDGALQRVLDKLDERGREPRAQAAVTAPRNSSWPSVLDPYLSGGAPSWRPLVPGIRTVELLPRTAAGGTTRLLSVAAGRRVVHHGHSGPEATLVLSGAFSDELGHFCPGDFAEMDVEIQHKPVADPGTDCICLIVTASPLRFAGRVARLVQPYFGV